MIELPHYDDAFERTNPRIENNAGLEKLLNVLRSEELTREIELGNITIAMVRPELGNSTISNIEDEEAAVELESAISNLGFAIKFSVQFDNNAMSAFYGGRPQEVQEAIPPVRDPRHRNRWEEFTALMTSGPSTVIFLYSPDGDAVSAWRQQVGHYDIVNRRDPSTIRGKFGIDNYNNLVHGSDSSKAVASENLILQGLLDRTAQFAGSNEPVSGYLDESLLAQLGIHSLTRENIVQTWLPSSETYYARLAINASGVVEELILKACIKMFPSEVMKDWIQRRALLEQNGIETPKLKAINGATIVEEYIPYTLAEAYNLGDSDIKSMLSNKFLATYKQVIASGFQPLSMMDSRSRGDDVVLVDFGEDLGSPSREANLDDTYVHMMGNREWLRIVGEEKI